MSDATTRSLSTIAREIRADWGRKVWFGAKPYLDAMSQLNSIDDKYIADDAATIVIYFLSNAASWRGEKAKAIKAELKAMLPQPVRRGSRRETISRGGRV